MIVIVELTVFSPSVTSYEKLTSPIANAVGVYTISLLMIAASPTSGAPTADIVKASPSGSVSFASASIDTASPLSVTAESATSTGSWLLSSEPPQAARRVELTAIAIMLLFILNVLVFRVIYYETSNLSG